MFSALSTLRPFNSEIFPVLNVVLVSYSDLKLQNANKNSRTHLLYNSLFLPPSNIFFYESFDCSQFIYNIFQIDSS